MKTIHPAIAEHVMEENERLRGLLREFCERVERGEVRSKSTYAKFRDALSQQAEPAPAQDERDSVIAHIELCITNLKAEHQTNPRVIAEVLYNIGYSRATRTVQTATQPEYDDTALFDALYKGQVAAEKAGMVNGTTQWGLCLLRHIRAALSTQGTSK